MYAVSTLLAQKVSLFVALAYLLLFSQTFAEEPFQAENTPDTSHSSARPNIAIVIIDDAALMDFSAYGGEIQTPVIDAFAANGIRFTNFRASPLCAPSRAMLLTGLNSHRAGVGNLASMIPSEHIGQPGYAGTLEPGITTIAARLRSNGYRTYTVGKWHLGEDIDSRPSAHGFDRSFVLNSSGGDHYSDMAHIPTESKTQWIEDGEPISSLPSDFYSTKSIVDKLIEYTEQDAQQDKPFFAYLAFVAAHYPLQAPAHNIEPYLETYRDGWNDLRRKRWETAKDMGLIPQEAELADMAEGFRAWDELTEAEKSMYAKRKAVYAGMFDSINEHLGRYVDFLKARNLFDNTVFVVLADNGPDGVEIEANGLARLWVTSEGYRVSPETYGARGSFSTMGPEWALASASPSDLFKGYMSEGGIRVPLIVSGPGIDQGRSSDAFTYVTDVAPTVLDLAGIDYERDDMSGRSLAEVLRNKAQGVYGPEDAVGMELAGNAALFRGDYKVTRNGPPFGDNTWRLFDLSVDPGETNDLSREQPELLASMIEDYEKYAEENGVLPVPAGYNRALTSRSRALPAILQQLWFIPAGILLIVVGALYAVWLILRGSVLKRPSAS